MEKKIKKRTCPSLKKKKKDQLDIYKGHKLKNMTLFFNFCFTI